MEVFRLEKELEAKDQQLETLNALVFELREELLKGPKPKVLPASAGPRVSDLDITLEGTIDGVAVVIHGNVKRAATNVHGNSPCLNCKGMIAQKTTENILNQGVWCPYSG